MDYLTNPIPFPFSLPLIGVAGIAGKSRQSRFTPFRESREKLNPLIETSHANVNVISNWWLIHFIDLDPAQVAIYPPCNHADVLALNHQAIAAEPISSPINDEAKFSSLGDTNE